MKLGHSHMIFVQKMRLKREEHYAVLMCMLMAQVAEDRFFIFFYFWHFFSTREIFFQFLEFCKDQGGKNLS